MEERTPELDIDPALDHWLASRLVASKKYTAFSPSMVWKVEEGDLGGKNTTMVYPRVGEPFEIDMDIETFIQCRYELTGASTLHEVEKDA